MTSNPEEQQEEDLELRSPWASDIEVWPEDEVEANRLRRSAEAHRTASKRQVEARRQAAFGRAPPAAFTIPQELYEKAAKHNNQLTADERDMLLSRGDAVGKALARPESLTPEERSEVLGRPPPDVLTQNIRRATGDALSTPTELYEKVHRLWRSEDMHSLSQAEISLLLHEFWEEGRRPDIKFKVKILGDNRAAELLQSLEGRHAPSVTDAMMRMSFIKSLPKLPMTAQQLQKLMGNVADAVEDLQKEWTDGEIGIVEYRLRNASCIEQLRDIARNPLADNYLAADVPQPLLALPISSFPPGVPSGPATVQYNVSIPSVPASAAALSPDTTLLGHNMTSRSGAPLKQMEPLERSVSSAPDIESLQAITSPDPPPSLTMQLPVMFLRLATARSPLTFLRTSFPRVLQADG